MEVLRTVILLLHPITAIAILAWMWWQYGWKRKSAELKGMTRREELERHERVGERILQAAILSVLIAFLARWYTGLGLIPDSLHGFTGPIGITLLWITARWGRKSRKDSVTKTKHGRAADLLIALMFFHSFLGFLNVFSIL
jgi:Co/Zn/Cd efflux system component